VIGVESGITRNHESAQIAVGDGSTSAIEDYLYGFLSM